MKYRFRKKRDLREVDELLAKHGKPMVCAPLDPNEVDYLEGLAQRIYKRGWRSCPPKLCHYNCMRLLCEDHEKRLTYCEGHVYNGKLQVLHAWLIIGGKVADPTIDNVKCKRAHDRNCKEHGWSVEPEGLREYFGVEIPTVEAARLRCEMGFSDLLIEDVAFNWEWVAEQRGCR
jgi:hypothetical protein